jgi:hypothetical protein
MNSISRNLTRMLASSIIVAICQSSSVWVDLYFSDERDQAIHDFRFWNDSGFLPNDQRSVSPFSDFIRVQ